MGTAPFVNLHGDVQDTCGALTISAIANIIFTNENHLIDMKWGSL